MNNFIYLIKIYCGVKSYKENSDGFPCNRRLKLYFGDVVHCKVLYVFWGRYGQTKTQLFSCFFNARMILVFVCHPFHLVLCSLFRLPGRLIAPFAINSRCLQSVPGSRFFNHFQFPGFVLKTSFSVPYHALGLGVQDPNL